MGKYIESPPFKFIISYPLKIWYNTCVGDDSMKENYQLKLDQILKEIEDGKKTPTLLLHSCCGPCSSYTLEYLSNYFKITVFYYNPNISPNMEFEKRFEEQKRLIENLPTKYPVSLIKGDYDPNVFFDLAKGLEKEPEGGKRCFKCYKMRMEECAKVAKEKGFDYFTTTLSISPYKNATWINEIGEELEKQYSIKYLYADLKKKNGYKRSIELSRQYQLYRQNYCGCVYSKVNSLDENVSS